MGPDTGARNVTCSRKIHEISLEGGGKREIIQGIEPLVAISKNVSIMREVLRNISRWRFHIPASRFKVQRSDFSVKSFETVRNFSKTRNLLSRFFSIFERNRGMYNHMYNREVDSLAPQPKSHLKDFSSDYPIYQYLFNLRLF